MLQALAKQVSRFDLAGEPESVAHGGHGARPPSVRRP